MLPSDMSSQLKQHHPDNHHLELADEQVDARFERMLQVASQRQRGLQVLMEDVYNPFNLAAIARTCDAFGVQELGFMCQEREAFNPREAGEIASRSAAKWLDYTLYEGGTNEVLSQFKRDGWHLVATSADREAMPLSQTNLHHEKLLLLVGNERKGLSETALSLADTKVVIPMVGMVQSLNVSVATALVLYEIVRQRGDSLHYTNSEAQALAERWQEKDREGKKRL